MNNESVTLTRETYHELMEESETLRALQEGLPVLVSEEDTGHYDRDGYFIKKTYEILYEGDEPLKEMVEKTSKEYLEYREKFNKKAGALMGVERSLKSSVTATWFWFAAFAISSAIHFIR